MGPPLHLIDFVEVKGNLLASGYRSKRPSGVVDADSMRQLALSRHASAGSTRSEGSAAYVDERLLALDGHLERVPGDLDVQVLALVLCIDGDCDVEVLDGLLPLVGQRCLLGVLLSLGLGVELLALLGRR